MYRNNFRFIDLYFNSLFIVDLAKLKAQSSISCQNLSTVCINSMVNFVKFHRLITRRLVKFKGVYMYKNHSGCPFVCADSFPVVKIFCLDNGIPFVGFLTCLCVQPITSVCFYISKSYLAHRFIIIRRCVTCIHEPDRTSTLQGFWHGFMIGPQLLFILWHWHMSVSPWDGVTHKFMISVWPWPFASILKSYFHDVFVSGQDCLCFLT